MPASALSTAAERIIQAQVDLVRIAAKRFDEIARESAGRALGGTPVMYVHARRGRRPAIKFRTVARINRTAGGAEALLRGVPVGPWVWLESGTGPHQIGVRMRGRGRNRRRSRLNIDGGWVTGPVHHPGAPGKLAWSRAVDIFAGEYRGLALRALRKKGPVGG